MAHITGIQMIGSFNATAFSLAPSSLDALLFLAGVSLKDIGTAVIIFVFDLGILRTKNAEDLNICYLYIEMGNHYFLVN